MANIKELIQSIESGDSSFDEKLAAINQMEETLVAMREQEQEAIDDNVELIIEALRTIEAKVEAKLRIVPEKGEQGIQGPKGEQGDRGLDGAQGKDGKSGVDGKDGTDGKDGVSVQDAKIDFDGSLVITLSDGREINVGEVVPVDVAQTIHKIQSGSGGDSQTVLDAIAALQATIATYGTMATQNANNVAITGGTINNTTIGATTPSTGVFTTLTAQNETLKGTGQNFFTTTTTFSNFGTTSGTITLSTATTDPFGGTSVYKLVANSGLDPNVGSSAILSNSGTVLPLGVLFTQSIYFKAAEFNALRIRNNSSGEIYTFTIGTTPSATAGVQTPALTLIGNGWYRASWTFVTGQIGSLGRADNWSFRLASTGDGTSGIYVSSPQLEYGSTLGTYVPNTTSSPLYGTPTLSFSGVASIGLQSDGSLYVQPAGTGALQAQATTSSATGGNARGANAVDWQTSRASASQVASGVASVISGGINNTSTGNYNFVGGGQTNAANFSFGGIASGAGNTVTANYSFIGGGNNNSILNSAASNFAFIGAGTLNVAHGIYNVTVGGQTNSGTSASAVTTQSGTMNGTTAVTLSGSNASIKVGQYITGTSIATDTYVAAISGTSLTLSKVASGSSTSTLSFYTPHGVVVGGGNNQATGSYSFIGGGGDAGTAANRNVASGDWSFVGGGMRNTASGIGAVVVGGGDGTATYANSATNKGSFVGGGINNSVTSIYGTIVNGALNQVSNQYAFVGGGYQNSASGDFSTVSGGSGGMARSITGYTVFPASFYPTGGGNGSSQAALVILATQTTDATATVLRSNSSAAGTTNQVILPNNSAYAFRGTVIANVTGGGNTKAWAIEGAIKRGANAASTALVGTPTVTSAYADVGAATWAIAVTADTTNGGLAVTFTGQASTTIRCVAKLETTEVTF